MGKEARNVHTVAPTIYHSSVSAAKLSLIRPLAGMDKQEVIDLAKKIGTYNISIRPYDDCCTVFVAKNPDIKPKTSVIEFKEEKITDLEEYIGKAVENAEIIEYGVIS